MTFLGKGGPRTFLIIIIITFLIILIPPSTLSFEPGDAYTLAEMKEAREMALKWHNIFRKWHNVGGAMTLDDRLNEDAQKYAEHLIQLGEMKHAGGIPEGENLYTVSHTGGRRFNAVEQGEKSVKAWYFELCDTTNYPTGELNHFTQVVWKDSIRLGIGIATDKANSVVFVVGRYDPAGNYVGEYSTGVLPLRCSKSRICSGMAAKDVKSVGDCLLEKDKDEDNEIEQDEGGDNKGRGGKDKGGGGKGGGTVVGVNMIMIIVTTVIPALLLLNFHAM